MKTDKNLGENHSGYNLRVKYIFDVKRSNLFWKCTDYLACKMKKLAEAYERTVGNEYRKEREKFNLSGDKTILHIGCGAYPITAMVLAEMDDVKITTIDKSHRSVKLANKIIHKKNLDDKIRAEYGDGTMYPIDGFDTVIISGCSVTKIQVFEHVVKNAKSKCKIIVRDSYLDIESVINDLALDQDIKITKKIENYAFPTSRWISYCLVKNN